MRGPYKKENNIILSISGFWESADRIRHLISESSNYKYQLIEDVLFCEGEREGIIFYFDDSVNSLTKNSVHSDANQLITEPGGKLNQHESTVYLKYKGGSAENAKKMMLAGNSFLDIGGYEIKIVTSGITHSKETWQKLIENDRVMDLIFAFVITIHNDKEDFYFTCGMHNLGYPDAIVPGYLDYDGANYLAKAFLYYLLLYDPVLHYDSRFRIDETSLEIYRLTHENCHIYDDYDENIFQLFHNPYGIWRLTESNI